MIEEVNLNNLQLKSKKYGEFVKGDIDLSNSSGFKETPSFIIMNSDGSNLQKIEGPKPFPIFKVVIDNIISQR